MYFSQKLASKTQLEDQLLILEVSKLDYKSTPCFLAIMNRRIRKRLVVEGKG